MKIMYVTSECAPFIKTGGLGDVAGSLPKALAAKGHDVRVFCPLYSAISEEMREKFFYIKNAYVRLGWRNQYCGIFRYEKDGVTYYFIDNEYYFARGQIYGEYDDAERFAYYSKAVLEVLPDLDWKPDVINCNDWQTALVPVYYNLMFASRPFYENIKTVFTIHNIQYQGRYGRETVEDLFGLDAGWFTGGTLAFDGDVNLLKGAIVTADAVTAVSPTYAQELKYAYFAHGLESVMQMVEGKLHGVLNGIDMVSYDPECDPDLPTRYTAAEPKGKTLCKAALQQELGLAQEEGTPVLSMVTRLVGHKGVDLVCQALDGIMATGCQLVVLGSGDGGYENFFRHAQNRYPGRLCAWIGYNEGLSRRIYAGSDLFLMPSKSEPCGLSQMIAMRYGAVPIVRQTGGLNDTVRSCQVGQPDGNGYVFAAYDAGAMLDTVGQAVGLYHGDAEGFRMVRRRGMEGDFSWDRSAGAYRNIYGKLLGR